MFWLRNKKIIFSNAPSSQGLKDLNLTGLNAKRSESLLGYCLVSHALAQNCLFGVVYVRSHNNVCLLLNIPPRAWVNGMTTSSSVVRHFIH